MNHNRGTQLTWALRGACSSSRPLTLSLSSASPRSSNGTCFSPTAATSSSSALPHSPPRPVRRPGRRARQIPRLADRRHQHVPHAVGDLMSFSAQYRGTALRLVLAHIAAVMGASAFAFFAIAAFQGVLINLTSPRLFRRSRPIVQMCGMSLTILSLLTYPIYMQLLRHAAVTSALALAVSARLVPRSLRPLSAEPARPLRRAWHLLPVHACRRYRAFAITWSIGFGRHYRRTLESEDTRPRAQSAPPPARLVRSARRASYLSIRRQNSRPQPQTPAIPGHLPQYRTLPGAQFRHSCPRRQAHAIGRWRPHLPVSACIFCDLRLPRRFSIPCRPRV